MSIPAAPLVMTADQGEVLGKIAVSRTAAHREVQRAGVLLAAADGVANARIAAEAGLTTATARAWRARFGEQGLSKVGKVAPGRAATMISDYKRNGTTTLFAALDVLTGTVIGQCMDKHRHNEFLRFMRKVDAQTPKGLVIHVILDTYATHQHATVKAWLEKHPRVHLHFTPTSSSWLNLVERWFRDPNEKALRRGVFHCVPDLIDAIGAYLDTNNNNPKPFEWTATADDILAKVARGRVALQTAN